eukprot:TRINITY_DN3335_c0_g1_i1.p1 TRINITY_DN3335_c0_g1~~TRINITY_DN3335_c0_g1_i1.p1  ORF type:complete len:808 (+),score=127.47 TRINITY_DN3335_c0_g1_i1:93-2426(+)
MENPAECLEAYDLIAEDSGGNILTICMLGATGAGKSSLCNALFGARKEDVFRVGKDMNSTTSDTTFKVRPWRGNRGRVRCVDTPGFMDSRGTNNDIKQAEEMANVLKKDVKYVHVFLLFFKRDDNKMAQPLKDMLITFMKMFGDGFVESVMLVFTHCEYTQRAKRQEPKKAKEMNEELRKIFKHKFDVPCVFVDNTLNSMSDEDLLEELGEDLDDYKERFEIELAKIMAFMKGDEPFFCPGGRQPFFCDGVEAVMERELTTKKLQEKARQGQFYDESRLGRALNHWSADSDTIHHGSLRWRRQKMYAVLKRQTLQIYRNDSCEKLVKSLDLTGCICFPVQTSAANLLSKQSWFAICRPVKDENGDRYQVEMSAESDDERRRWMLLVLEASQITESWHRIHNVHERLRDAKTKRDYIEAIEQIESKTVVIPIVWVNMLKGGSREPSPKQLHADLKRDVIMVNGRKFAKEDCDMNTDTLTAEIGYHILQSIRSQSTEELDDGQAACSEARAMILARDVVMGCSRTFGQGDSFAGVVQLFGSTELVGVSQTTSAEDTVTASIMDGRKSQDALNALKNSLSLPQFEGDTDSASMTKEAVEKISCEGEQRLEGTMVSQESWFQDWETNECMWCSVRFRTWLRRHHCRACGAIACFNCTRHSLCFDESQQPARACWLCYKKAAIRELNKRKVPLTDDLDQSGDSVPEAQDEESNEVVPVGIGADELELPLVNIEMSFRYRIHTRDPISEEDADWYFLDCKYMRVVRWSGLADEGRVIISLTAA